MLNGYKKLDALLFVRRAALVAKKMKAELHEHRYYLEQKVERRTEHLLKRIAVLEACNATLCDKLALAQRGAAAPQPGSARPNERAAKLYLMNSPIQQTGEHNVQENRSERAIAA